MRILLGPAGLESQNHVGYIFSERLINMPVQTVPPMYRLLGDELKWALEEVCIPIGFKNFPKELNGKTIA